MENLRSMLIGVFSLICYNGFSQDFVCERDTLSALHMKNYGVKTYKPKLDRDNSEMIVNRGTESPGHCSRDAGKPSELRIKKYFEEQRNIFYKRQTKLSERS